MSKPYYVKFETATEIIEATFDALRQAKETGKMLAYKYKKLMKLKKLAIGIFLKVPKEAQEANLKHSMRMRLKNLNLKLKNLPSLRYG